MAVGLGVPPSRYLYPGRRVPRGQPIVAAAPDTHRCSLLIYRDPVRLPLATPCVDDISIRVYCQASAHRHLSLFSVWIQRDGICAVGVCDNVVFDLLLV